MNAKAEVANDTLSLQACWHPIAELHEVTTEPRAFQMLGVPIVAFRDSEGVVAFKDVCIHRGAALSLGAVKDGRLACAYHGWEYDRNGACVRIPSRPPEAPIPDKARAISYKTREAYGLVWVALREPTVPLPMFPENGYDRPEWRAFICRSVVWRTSAGRAVENFMDFSHFPFVHAGLLDPRTEVEPHDIFTTDYGFKYSCEQEEKNELYGTCRFRYDYTIDLPFTAHLMKVQPGGETTLLSLIAAPIAAKLTHLYVYIIRNFALEKDDAEFAAFTNKIFDQDQAVVESQRPEELPADLREELHIRVPDAAGIEYRRQLGRFSEFATTGTVVP